MKTLFCSLAFLFLSPLAALANDAAKAAVDAYFDAMRGERYVEVAEMITPPELERFRSIWTAFVIMAENLPEGSDIAELYAQGESPRALEQLDPKESLIRFLRLASETAVASKALQPPSKYKIHRFIDSPDLPSLIINYNTDEGNKDMEYRFDISSGSWKLFLPDPILHAVNKIGRAARGLE